ncbi:MAG: NAD(P)H-hydrate dehydratase [Christensenella sp.]|nr:NAD(P)H-hydrate dehydratase [Christensenella sp.]
MKRVVSAEEMRAYEQERFADGRASSLDWMERAATGVALLLQTRYPLKSVLVICGGGNNGGDGFALLRLLKQRGVECTGVLLAEPERLAGDAKTNYLRALDCGVHFYSNLTQELISEYDVLVDALFGTGLSREITGAYAEAILAINASGKPVVAVDLPSGVDATTGAVLGVAVRASETVTFEFLKRGHLLFPGRELCGEVVVHPLSNEADDDWADVSLLERNDVQKMLPKRPADSNKGSNGRLLLCAGSERYTGAALLCTGAALRAGAGLTTVAVPSALKPAFAALPEAMAVPVNEGKDWDETACEHAIALFSRQNAVGVGPGIGDGSILPLLETLMHSRLPAVLDADALNQISRSPDLLKQLHPSVVLTPHPVEMARLCGLPVEAILADPIETARRFAKQWSCVVLLKGATTCISNGTTVRLNTSGNPGLAKGGSGDVLTGIIAALLAQGLGSFDAASAGAFLLGASADTALELLQERMLLARDVIDAVEQMIRG